MVHLTTGARFLVDRPTAVTNNTGHPDHRTLYTYILTCVCIRDITDTLQANTRNKICIWVQPTEW
jgi:hypothetical protein